MKIHLKKKIKRIKKERFHICIYISACCVCTHKTRVRYVECAIIQFSRVVFCISAKDAWFYIVSYLYVCGYNILFYFYYIVVQKKHMSGSKSTSPFMYNWKCFNFKNNEKKKCNNFIEQKLNLFLIKIYLLYDTLK